MKNRFLLPALAVVGGIGAFALRLLQLRTGFEASTGLPVPGAPAGIALIAALIALALIFLVLCRSSLEKSVSTLAFPDVFPAESPSLLLLPVMGIFLLLAAGAADIYEGVNAENLLIHVQSAAGLQTVAMPSKAYFSPRLQVVLGIMTALSAVALFPATAACKNSSRWNATHGNLLLIPPVVLVVRLIFTYRLNSANPSIEVYYVELLALVFLTLGFFRLSSFAFDAGRTSRFALYTCCATVLSLAALSGSEPHLSALLLYAGGSAVLMGFLLLRLCRATKSE